jgi:anti-sigma28 factor (negative regulator of flagellin synthesis)
MNVPNSLNKVSSNSPVNKLVGKPIQKQVPADAPKQLPVTDRVEISGMSHLLKTLKSGGDVRIDKVEAIKKQLDAGTYEAEDKLDIAADRLLDDLLK